MTSFTSILDTNELPPADSKVVYQYHDEVYGLCEVSTFLTDASEKDVIRAVDSLRAQANDDHHVFIEGFIQRDEDRAYRVILGS
jgi:hypothetical protein